MSDCFFSLGILLYLQSMRWVSRADLINIANEENQ